MPAPFGFVDSPRRGPRFCFFWLGLGEEVEAEAEAEAEDAVVASDDKHSCVWAMRG